MNTKKDCHWAIDNGLEVLNREDLFDEMLNECNEPVVIIGLSYDPAHALKEVDPIAYRCAVNDYIDSLLTDGDISELEDGTIVRTSDLEALETDQN